MYTIQSSSSTRTAGSPAAINSRVWAIWPGSAAIRPVVGDVLARNTPMTRNAPDKPRSGLQGVPAVKETTQLGLAGAQSARRLLPRPGRHSSPGLPSLQKTTLFLHYSIRQANPGLWLSARPSPLLRVILPEPGDGSGPWIQQANPSREP